MLEEEQAEAARYMEECRVHEGAYGTREAEATVL